MANLAAHLSLFSAQFPSPFACLLDTHIAAVSRRFHANKKIVSEHQNWER